jgi:hypothetical protein
MWTREHEGYPVQPTLGDSGLPEAFAGERLRRHGRSGRLGWVEARRGVWPARPAPGVVRVRPMPRRADDDES